MVVVIVVLILGLGGQWLLVVALFVVALCVAALCVVAVGGVLFVGA